MLHPIHTLWCHPRSVSTAFERVMRERADCHVFHEPFMYHYYLDKIGEIYDGFEPDPDHPRTYDEIRKMVLDQARVGPVFQKDMAYYVVPEILQDRELLSQMTHAILVRDPAESILSYSKITKNFTIDEVGIKSQWELYSGLQNLDIDVHVISADSLRADTAQVMSAYWAFAGLPQKPEALAWDQSMPKGWETVATWHKKVLETGAIKAPENTDALAKLQELGAPYIDYYAELKPYYEKLRVLAD